MLDITLLPSAKVPLIYSGDTTMTTEWYRFFWNVYGFTGDPSGAVPVNKGGTGFTSYDQYDLLIGNDHGTLDKALLTGTGITISYTPGFINLALGESGVIPGTYGTVASVPEIVVNKYGVITAANNIAIQIDATQIVSGIIDTARIAGSYTGITGVGTLNTGTWQANTIGTLYGGTGLTGFTSGGALYATSSSTLTSGTLPTTAGGTGLTAFTSGGALYATSTSALTTGTLPVASGGTGQTSFTNGQLLIGNTTGNTLTKATLTAGTGVSITNGNGSITISATGSGGTVTSVSGTAPISVATGTTTPVISISQATTSTNGYLSSTDWNTFNNKAPGVTFTTNYIPFGQGTTTLNQSSKFTYDGTTVQTIVASAGKPVQWNTTSNTSGIYLTLTDAAAHNIWAYGAGVNLGTTGTYAVSISTNSIQRLGVTANGGFSFGATNTAYGTSGQVLTSAGDAPPTWTTPASGTVTSVAALTLGTSGTDLSSTVANSTTTPVITLNVPTASATNRGALSAADWTTFNNKQPAGTYVTSISIASSNGFTGTSSGGATPSLTLATSVTGILKGNGTAISAATSGTDYASPTSGTSILYGNGAGGFSNVTIGTGVSFTGGTLSATGTGGTVTSVSGTSPVSVATGTTTPVISLASGYGDTQNPYASKTANYFLAAPNGSAGVPTFRAIVAADIPALSYVTSVSGTGSVNGITLTGTVTSSGSLTLGGILSGIGNSQLTNSTISGVSLGGNLFNLTAGTGVSFSTGTTYNGSAAITINATGTGGTVTSVAALTLGTTGTDLSSTVANGTTTPVITLNVPTASATNRGALSSTDWSTFNSKQAALVSGTNIKTVGGVSLLGSGDVGTIGIAYGGTGLTSFTANQIHYGSFSQSSGLTFNGTTFATTNDATISTLTIGRGNSAVATNTAIGVSALGSNTSGNNCVGVGYRALYTNSSGANNTALGALAMGNAVVTGSNNVSIGLQSLYVNTSGEQNTAAGVYTLTANISGSYNAAFGLWALAANTTSNANTAIGYQALYSQTGTSGPNTAVGYQTGLNVTSGAANVFMGAYAGYWVTPLTTGSNNVYIGTYTVPSAAGVNNETVLGYNGTGKGANTAFIGGSSGAYNGANAVNWSITSDRRIKENITTITNGLSTILALNPVEFDYILDGRHDVSFIAQEYREVLPNQVVTHAATPDEQALTGEDTLLGLQQNLVPYLVSAVQELMAELNDVKTQLNALKGTK